MTCDQWGPMTALIRDSQTGQILNYGETSIKTSNFRKNETQILIYDNSYEGGCRTAVAPVVGVKIAAARR